MSVLIGRPINGVSLNGNEYICGDDGIAIAFEDREVAVAFLKGHGMTDEDIEAEGIVFEDAGDGDE